MFLSCANEKGDIGRPRFCEAEKMSPVLAALQYITLSVAVMEVGNPDSSTRMTSCGRTSDQANEELVSSVNVNRNYVESYIRNALNVCMSIMKLHKSESVFEECVQHTLCGFINGGALSLSVLGSALKDWHKQASTMLTKKLAVWNGTAQLRYGDVLRYRR